MNLPSRKPGPFCNIRCKFHGRCQTAVFLCQGCGEKQEQFNLGIDLGFFDDRLNLTVDAYYKRSDDMLMSMQLPSYMGTQGNGSSRIEAPKGNYGSIENKGIEITLDAHPFVGEFQWDSNFQNTFPAIFTT